MSYMTKKRTSGYMGAATIVAILIMSMMARCAPVETQAQMEKDIAGLTQAQRAEVMTR